MKAFQRTQRAAILIFSRGLCDLLLFLPLLLPSLHKTSVTIHVLWNIQVRMCKSCAFPFLGQASKPVLINMLTGI